MEKVMSGSKKVYAVREMFFISLLSGVSITPALGIASKENLLSVACEPAANGQVFVSAHLLRVTKQTYPKKQKIYNFSIRCDYFNTQSGTYNSSYNTTFQPNWSPDPNYCTFSNPSLVSGYICASINPTLCAVNCADASIP